MEGVAKRKKPLQFSSFRGGKRRGGGQKGLVLRELTFFARGQKIKGFTNKKLSYFKKKTQLCDPFDIKLRDCFIDVVFAYHNPSARL